jgi:hypothetical protein
MATSTVAPAPSVPKVGADEAEQIAKEFIAKKFNLNDPQVITIAFNPSYGTFTVSVTKKDRHRYEVPTTEQEKAQRSPTDQAPAPDTTQRRLRGTRSYDVTVDKSGLVVGWARLIRTSEEAESIAREYALERHELTHFIPYTTTFDGTYFTVYGGGLIYEGGLVRSALKLYKSKFYDVKVDKSGLVVGYTTEGLVTHYSAKLQRLR